MTHRNSDASGRSRWLAATLLIVLAGAVPTLAAPGEVCYVAEIPWAFVTPDGSVHEEGLLRLCLWPFTPSTTIHRIYVDGRLVGVCRSRVGTSEVHQGQDAYVTFLREGSSPLVLTGFGRPDGDRYLTYALGGESYWQHGQQRAEAGDDGRWAFVAAIGR